MAGGKEVPRMNQNFTYVRLISLLPSMPCSGDSILQGFSKHGKNFTAVTLLDNHVRGIFRKLKNGLYFILFRILRTYGTYVPFMIEIGRDRGRRGGERNAQ